MVLTLFQPQTHPPLKKQQDVLTALKKLMQSYGKTLETPTIETVLQVLLDARQEARKKKEYKTADDIRKNLEALGFEIQDTAAGPVWRKK